MPTASAGFVAGKVGEQILVIGGTTWFGGQKRWLDNVTSYSKEAGRWRSAGHASVSIAYAAFGHDSQAVYWLGGTDGERTFDSLCRAVAPESIRHIADTGRRVAYAGAAIHDGAMYVVAGGEDADDLTTLSDRFFRVSLDDGRIEELPTYPGGAVMAPAVACSGHEVFVFGGARYDAAKAQVTNVDTAFAYSFRNRNWRRLAPLPVARRGMTACRLPDGQVMIGGGFGEIETSSVDGFAADTYLYLPQKNHYAKGPDLPYAAMGHGLILNTDWVYLMGGEDNHRQRTDAFYRIRPRALYRR